MYACATRWHQLIVGKTTPMDHPKMESTDVI